LVRDRGDLSGRLLGHSRESRLIGDGCQRHEGFPLCRWETGAEEVIQFAVRRSIDTGLPRIGPIGVDAFQTDSKWGEGKECAYTMPPNEKGVALFLGGARQLAKPRHQRTMTDLLISLRITMMRMMRIASPMRRPRPSSAPAPARSVRDASRCRSRAL